MKRRYKYDYVVYGMPVYRIEADVYGGLYGNATRAVGLANNLAKTGHRTALVVESGFEVVSSEFLCEDLEFIDKSAYWEEEMRRGRTLLICCTNIESFKKSFGQNPYVQHHRKFYVCCFDNNQSLDIDLLQMGAIGISFNNEIQHSMWRARRTGIPSHLIPYGVNELPMVDDCIRQDIEPSAIWIGEFRRGDMVSRLVDFAIANPRCSVSVITRKIFDQTVPKDEPGGANQPYADFRRGDPDWRFYDVVRQIAGRCPENIDFLGMREGENHTLLGEHTIGLDFSRFPAQRHDNTKIMDYLRSGLAVICDKGTPSYRFVHETGFGCVMDPTASLREYQRAYEVCRELLVVRDRKVIARDFCDKYGWHRTTCRVLEAIESHSWLWLKYWSLYVRASKFTSKALSPGLRKKYQRKFCRRIL